MFLCVCTCSRVRIYMLSGSNINTHRHFTFDAVVVIQSTHRIETQRNEWSFGLFMLATEQSCKSHDSHDTCSFDDHNDDDHKRELISMTCVCVFTCDETTASAPKKNCAMEVTKTSLFSFWERLPRNMMWHFNHMYRYNKWLKQQQTVHKLHWKPNVSCSWGENSVNFCSQRKLKSGGGFDCFGATSRVPTDAHAPSHTHACRPSGVHRALLQITKYSTVGHH